MKFPLTIEEGLSEKDIDQLLSHGDSKYGAYIDYVTENGQIPLDEIAFRVTGIECNGGRYMIDLICVGTHPGFTFRGAIESGVISIKPIHCLGQYGQSFAWYFNLSD